MQNTIPEFSEKLLSRREQIGFLIGWERPGRRKIPSDQIALFVVETLKLDLLTIPEIRKIYIKGSVKENPLVSKELDSIFGNDLPNDRETEFWSYAINLGTNLARDFCQIVGVPLIFSAKGTSDKRLFHESVRSVKRLHPLTDYQKRVCVESQSYLSAKNGRCLIIMPTGSGKTRTTIESIFQHNFALEQSNVVLWIADRDELCEQAFQSFKQIFVNACLDVEDEFRQDKLDIWRYWGGMDRGSPRFFENRVNGVVISSVQQLQSRIRGSALGLGYLPKNHNGNRRRSP